jgi:hypothetical protein
MAVVLLARAHPPAKNAGRVGQPRFENSERMGQPPTLDAQNSDSPVARDSSETEERDKELPLTFPSEMQDKLWNFYLESVQPGPNYSLTIERKRMLAARHAEMVAAGKTPKKAAEHMGEAIYAFSQDDYFMGRKMGYEGAGRKGIEEIFRNQEVFEDWCSKYDPNE